MNKKYTIVLNLSSGHSSLSLSFAASQSLESLFQSNDLTPYEREKVLDCFRICANQARVEFELTYRKQALILEKSLCDIFLNDVS
jgi:hypothetical protein